MTETTDDIVDRLNAALEGYPTYVPGILNTAKSEIERLRGLCLPEFEGEIACKHMRMFSPSDGDGWVCHWWSDIDDDPRKQTYGEGPTIRDAIASALKAREALKNV